MREPSSYIPRIVLENVKKSGEIYPISLKMNAGVLFLDISSYTKLTEKLSAEGHYGVESITGILNSFFEIVVNSIHLCGGSVMKFGGDAILSIFPGEKEFAGSKMKNCREMIMCSLRELNISFDEKYKINIAVHGGLSWGKVELNIIGNNTHHYDYYLVGEPLDTAYEITDSALPEEINNSVELDEVGMRKLEPVGRSKTLYEEIALQFFPNVIRKKKGDIFSAELRETVVLFISFSSKGENKEINPIDFQKTYLNIQDIVYSLDGIINKIDFTDKGYMMLVTFGIPFIHLDDIERAFICGHRITQLEDKAVKLKIGITRDTLYSGIIGGKNRHEYGIIGDAVNTAARLVSIGDYGEVLFNSDILNVVETSFKTQFVKSTHVKGKKDLISVHKIVEEISENLTAFRKLYYRVKLYGDTEDLHYVNNSIDNEIGGLFFISGDAGTGKSLFVYKAIEKALQKGKHIELITLDEYNKTGQFELVFKIFRRRLHNLEIPKNMFPVKEFCDKNNLSIDFELMVNHIKPKSQIDDTNDDEKDNVALENLSDILTALYRDMHIIVIDNIHWTDVKSLDVLKKAIPKLLAKDKTIIFTSRDIDLDPHFSLFVTKEIELRNFNLRLMSQYLHEHFTNVTDDAIEKIFDITEGNPFHLKEVTSILKENIDFTKEVLSASLIQMMMDKGIIPKGISQLLLNQFDGLNTLSKTVLKIASIVGKAFSLHELQLIGEKQFRQDTMKLLDHLVNNYFLLKKTINPVVEYVFTNTMMRDAIYRTIPMGEKKELHFKIAEYYEDEYKSNLYPYYEILATHYSLTDYSDKALKYNKHAGKKLSDNFAYIESNHYYLQAMRFVSEPKEKQDLQLCLAELHLRQGDTHGAKEILDKLSLELAEKNEKYLYLRAREYNNQSEFNQLKEFVTKHISEMSIGHYKNLMRIYQLDALRQLGESHEFEELAAIFVEELKDTGDYFTQAKLATVQGLYYFNRAEYNRALNYYQITLEHTTKCQNKIWTRKALHNIGTVYFKNGDMKNAMDYYEKALKIAEKTGDKNAYTKVMSDIATIYRTTGDNVKAIETYKRGLNLVQYTGNKMQESILLYNTAESYFWLEQFESALEYLDQSEILCHRISNKRGLTFANDLKGDIFFRLGKIEEANKVYRNNLVLQEELHDTEGIGHTYGNLANIEKERENYNHAERLYRKQRDILVKVGDKDGEGRAWFNLAMIDVERKKISSAKRRLKKALRLFNECSFQAGIDLVNQQLELLE